MRLGTRFRNLYDSQQLWLPLVNWVYAPPPDLPQGWFDEDMDRVAKEDVNLTIAAMQRAVDVMHESLLWRSLELLGYPGSPEEKAEILEWIYEPDLVQIDQTVVDNRRCAWSFAMCCKVIGIDPDAMREQIDQLIEGARKRIQVTPRQAALIH